VLRTDVSGGGSVYELKAIRLDNGDVLYPAVWEQEEAADYVVELVSLNQYNAKERAKS
jgi:hypothetical protein